MKADSPILSENNKKHQLYWMLHLTGWLAYVLFKLFVSNYAGEAPLKILLQNYSIAFVAIITSTHFYKKWILSKWVNMPIRKLPLRLMAGGLVIILCIAIITMLLALLVVLVLSLAGTPASIKVSSENRSDTGMFIFSLFTDYIAIFLWSVIYMAFRYFENLQLAKIQRAKDESLVKDMHLNQLIRQLNPHFLFNAINSIKALTIIDAEKARDALSRMSDILRHTLNSEKSVQIPLQKELLIVEDYLALEKIRFGKRLEYSITCSTEAARCTVPPVIVQTLAENAVKHGISHLEQGGEVKIEANVEKDLVVVRIRNTGTIDTGKLFSGIGTNNTLHRLKLLYGEKASFTALNEEGKVIVTLKIPIAS